MGIPRVRKPKVLFWTAVVLAAISGNGIALGQESHIGKLTGKASAGKQVFRRYCIGCHGPYGDGEGENAQWLTPKPRDFTAGLFKCRSTPSGSIPTDSDLFNTIGRGLNTSGMPQWMPLSKQDRADLVAYVKTFSSRFAKEKPDPPIQIPKETANSHESIARGQKLYEVMKCWECHGKEGRGNGPSAATLRDDKGEPIVPYNFAIGGRFKCGSSDADLYKIFMTGLDGTPMPSYGDSLKPDQAWDLVHFLRTLRENQGSTSRNSIFLANDQQQTASAP